MDEFFVVNVEGSATDNIDHRTPVQIIKFFRIGHDEVPRPQLAYFLFGEWNRRYSEWPEIVLKTAEPFQDLRR